ncbi:hypothetical protein K438DRAFT_1991414 [Mycena galopus ATCC 62051]|nr:hypothetical protein K438DRAFT_1991414 [Mycena galopus ATCC 62051]
MRPLRIPARPSNVGSLTSNACIYTLNAPAPPILTHARHFYAPYVRLRSVPQGLADCPSRASDPCRPLLTPACLLRTAHAPLKSLPVQRDPKPTLNARTPTSNAHALTSKACQARPSNPSTPRPATPATSKAHAHFESPRAHCECITDDSNAWANCTSNARPPFERPPALRTRPRFACLPAPAPFEPYFEPNSPRTPRPTPYLHPPRPPNSRLPKSNAVPHPRSSRTHARRAPTLVAHPRSSRTHAPRAPLPVTLLAHTRSSHPRTPMSVAPTPARTLGTHSHPSRAHAPCARTLVAHAKPPHARAPVTLLVHPHQPPARTPSAVMVVSVVALWNFLSKSRFSGGYSYGARNFLLLTIFGID